MSDNSDMWECDEIIRRFREYLMIPSVHPDVDYGKLVINKYPNSPYYYLILYMRE